MFGLPNHESGCSCMFEPMVLRKALVAPIDVPKHWAKTSGSAVAHGLHYAATTASTDIE